MCAPSTSGTTSSHLVVSTTMEARLLSKATSTIGSITAAELRGFSAQYIERERPLLDAGGAGLWLVPGTHIMSDGWPAYHSLDQINGGVYLHDVVIHEQSFVDPLYTEIHTQNVENMWMRANRKLRRQIGTPRPLFIIYL